MLRLNGITPVMVTCFRDDESIDEEALRRQIDFAIEGGSSAICGPGFGAEYYKLSDEERRHFVEIMVDHTRRRVPTIAATSSGSTASTIEFSRFAEQLGADLLMISAPRVVPLPATAVIEHYSAICGAVSIPVMLQDADFTGAGLPVHVFLDLAQKHDNFRFAKLEVILPGKKCFEIVEQSGGKMQVIYGFGGLSMLDGLAHGASAIMPGAACIEVYHRVYRLYVAGRKEQAAEVFHRLLPYLSFAMQHLEVGIHMEKRVMRERGILPNAHMRRPTMTLDPLYQDQMDGIVRSVIALCEECRAANLRESAEPTLQSARSR